MYTNEGIAQFYLLPTHLIRSVPNILLWVYRYQIPNNQLHSPKIHHALFSFLSISPIPAVAEAWCSDQSCLRLSVEKMAQAINTKVRHMYSIRGS